MAKATKQYEESNEENARGVPIHGQFVDYDEQRLEYEKKDRARLRTEFVELSPEEIALMKRVKAAFDPAGILNPGKIFP